MPGRVAKATAILAGVTVALALIAAFVAVMAYVAAAGEPYLRPRIDTTNSVWNMPFIQARADFTGRFSAEDYVSFLFHLENEANTLPETLLSWFG
jgi:hypothetical protein